MGSMTAFRYGVGEEEKPGAAMRPSWTKTDRMFQAMHRCEP